ncbi:MAG: hypothetical protein GZ088_17060 [Acidipila sp.]|nr:hypothetical protein [Acidipila sp.]
MKLARANVRKRATRSYRRAAHRTLHLALAFVCVVSAGTRAIAQDTPLTRSFHAQSSVSFRVHLIVRTEVEGQRTEKIGEMTYSIPFRHIAEGRVAWRSTQRTIAVSADGSAQLEESMDNFSTVKVTSEGQDQDVQSQNDQSQVDSSTVELLDGLRDTLTQWAKNQSLRYRLSAQGAVLEPSASGSPPFQETAPALMGSWLMHALRPAAVLPARPLRLNDRWQEPRSAPAASWKGVTAMESGEWLDAPGHHQAAVRLHTVQQIAASLQTMTGETSAEIHFHGESLNTLALQNGALISATRSASREQLRVLDAVPGLPEPPRFQATLSLQVEIEQCDDAECESSK